MIEPLFDYVIIDKDEEKTKTAGGLVIPDSQKEKPSTGTIIATGTGALNDDGSVSPMFVKVGDRVVFPKLAGKTIKVDDSDKLILKQTDILGIIR